MNHEIEFPVPLLLTLLGIANILIKDIKINRKGDLIITVVKYRGRYALPSMWPENHPIVWSWSRSDAQASVGVWQKMFHSDHTGKI